MKPDHLHTLSAPDVSARVGASHSTAVDRWALARIQQGIKGARICLRLWDGFELSPPEGSVSTVTIADRRTLWAWLWDPELNFGEAYMAGTVDVTGDLVTMLTEVYGAMPVTRRRSWWLWQSSNDMRAARENVHRHYDLGNDFYRLWLDTEMVYTCAYFPTRASTLEEAQIAKMDLVSRKLHLRPGERVLEAGCGWGSLALFMAQRYGVSVRAFNLSEEQIAYARERAAREGLAGRVEFVEDDYRNATGVHDVFVSVGMLEHVGLPDYPTFGRVIDRTLAPDGRGLLHFIGRNRPSPLNPWIRKRIFPGGYPPTLSEVAEGVLQPQNFSVLDVENLRLHYAETLEHWRQRFSANAVDVARMFDDTFVRAWTLYLAGSQAAFTSGGMQLFQIVFARGATNDIPWTRATS